MMERVIVFTGRLERVVIGVFALLLGFVLVGLCMVFGQGVPLPLDAICLRG